MSSMLFRKVIATIVSLLVFLGLYRLAGLLDLGPRSFVYGLTYGVVLLGCPIVTYLIVSRATNRMVLQSIRVVVSLLVGFLGLLPLGALFDTMNWPVFHTWGLGHGSFVIAAPAIGSVSYLLLGRAFRLTRQPKAV